MTQLNIKVAYVVFGISVAGIASALELADKGYLVCLVALQSDLEITNFLSIASTPLNTEELTGEAFWALAVSELKRKNVALFTAISIESLSLNNSENDLFFTLRGILQGQPYSLSFNAAVFAPGGSISIDLPSELNSDHLRGFSVNFCAWSDGVVYRNAKVAVVGNNDRVVEEALHLAKYAQEVTIICELEVPLTSKLLLDKALQEKKIHLLSETKVKRILSTPTNEITGVLVRKQNTDLFLDVTGVFFATRVQPDWSLWGGIQSADLLIGQSRLFPCGIALGIYPYDFKALYNDGIRAAKACIQTNFGNL